MTPLLLNIISAGLALYVIAESIHPIADMPGKFNMFCEKMKYLAAIAVSVRIFFLAIHLNVSHFNLWLMATIALFLWPRTIWRAKRFFNIPVC